LKKKDWVAVGRIVSKRKRDGKESEVLLDGFRLSSKKVRKEVSRNNFPSALEHCIQGNLLIKQRIKERLMSSQ